MGLKLQGKQECWDLGKLGDVKGGDREDVGNKQREGG